VRITEEGQVVYKAEKERCQEYPELVGKDLCGGVARNYQVFEPLDFLAELTQHIPNQGEHLIRYYGCYSNKARRKRAGAAGGVPVGVAADIEVANGGAGPAADAGVAAEAEGIGDKAARRRWAMLIRKVYQVDPLVCPKCGGLMKIITFIEAKQGDVIRKILEHCGLWKPPPARPPPRPPPPGSGAAGQGAGSARGSGRFNEVEADPDFLEHLRLEKQAQQMNLPWD